MSEKLEPLTICSTCNKHVYFEDYASIKDDYDWCKCYRPDTTEEWMTSAQQRETARLRAALAQIGERLEAFIYQGFIAQGYTHDNTERLLGDIHKIIADAEK